MADCDNFSLVQILQTAPFHLVGGKGEVCHVLAIVRGSNCRETLHTRDMIVFKGGFIFISLHFACLHEAYLAASECTPHPPKHKDLLCMLGFILSGVHPFKELIW